MDRNRLEFRFGEHVIAHAADGQTMPYGCASMILEREYGPLCILAPRAVTDASDTLYVERNGTLEKIGTRAEPFHTPTNTASSCVNLLGCFQLADGVAVEQQDLSAEKFARPEHLLLSNVAIYRSDTKINVTGYVADECSSQLFENPNAGQPIPYAGLLKIASFDAGKPFCDFDDIGALIVTEDKFIAGILVGIKDGFGIAVPVSQVLEEWYSLDENGGGIADAERLREHNDLIEQVGLPNLDDIFTEGLPLEPLASDVVNQILFDLGKAAARTVIYDPGELVSDLIEREIVAMTLERILPTETILYRVHATLTGGTPDPTEIFAENSPTQRIKINGGSPWILEYKAQKELTDSLPLEGI